MEGIPMSSPKFDLSQVKNPMMRYFEAEDVIHFAIADGLEVDAIEVSADVTAELNGAGEVIGVEILNASRFFYEAMLGAVEGGSIEVNLPERKVA
jgi:uncharacterized protein YuzE